MLVVYFSKGAQKFVKDSSFHLVEASFREVGCTFLVQHQKEVVKLLFEP